MSSRIRICLIKYSSLRSISKLNLKWAVLCLPKLMYQTSYKSQWLMRLLGGSDGSCFIINQTTTKSQARFFHSSDRPFSLKKGSFCLFFDYFGHLRSSIEGFFRWDCSFRKVSLLLLHLSESNDMQYKSVWEHTI